jgi:hypothetical protein
MVSSIGDSQSNVAQVLREQKQRVDEQQVKSTEENTRKNQIRATEVARTEQTQNNADERRGNTVNISV